MDCEGGGKSNSNSKGGGGGGPCGACKFLRRKCVRGCIFAPYFESEQGAAHFAAVHKVFGASNASKLLSRIPTHHRLDAVLTLSYEALARAKDPVYGCVAHIFVLQHQVVKLQAELAYVQARLSTLQHIAATPPFPFPFPHETSSSSDTHISIMHYVDHNNIHLQPLPPSLTTLLNPSHDDNLQDSAQEFALMYLAAGSGPRF
ncbi:LOB domain-containing protein 19-like [Senna tora]|uniref:LOB domain-containing protein 19-like n=1 Tax=Senna tora TaxID=362788 RepID=A0A834XGP4_9FABA|nr:LOB domain-containing protein 19-like [Senna tora]